MPVNPRMIIDVMWTKWSTFGSRGRTRVVLGPVPLDERFTEPTRGHEQDEVEHEETRG